MKNKIKTIFWCGIVSLFLGITSCQKYLDREEESILNETVAFKNFKNFQGFTEELYMLIPDLPKGGGGVADYNWGEDIISSLSHQNRVNQLIDRGDYRALLGNFECFLDKNYNNDPMGPSWMYDPPKGISMGPNATRSVWKPSWYGIRKANIGLANLNLLTDATDEEKDLIKGQLLFFRAFFHFQLIQYWGPMPYINEVLPSDKPLRILRPKTYQEVADKIGDDFRAAADLLPFHWDNTVAGQRTLGFNRYRCNKAMALAFMAKNYLYAGSPLMNKQSTGSESYNAEYCKKAAAVAAELLKYVDSGQTHHRLVDWANITDLFYTVNRDWLIPGSTEAIFQAPNYFAQATNWDNSRVFGPQEPIGRNTPVYVATANYVKYYGMANGKPLDDPTSGYDPAFPWRNRDPRFYKDIICDGRKCVQGTLSLANEKYRYASLFTGGFYRNVVNGSRTGYLMYKWIPITANIHDAIWDQAGALTFHGTYIRLADVYLMYAEAVAMGYNSSMATDPNYTTLSATGAVNVIRARSNVGLLADNLDMDKFMSELRRERAVELAFEGHRFNDLRRWLLLDKYPYNIKTAHEFDRVGEIDINDVGNNQVANLREVVLVERALAEKHYWIPLRLQEANLYEEFPQNPGW